MKKHDFIKIDYTGKLEDGSVFDTTDADTAKQAGLGNENSKFGSVTICLGENHILPGIEELMIKQEQKEYDITLDPENAFGKKNAKLLKLMPMKVFRKQKIQPFPGLEVNIDNQFGIVRSVSGGRVIVDFNHPLSGRKLIYNVKFHGVVTDVLEKAKSVFKNELNIIDDILEVRGTKLIIKEEKFPLEVLENVKIRVLELVPEIKDVGIAKPKEPVKEKTAKLTDEESINKEFDSVKEVKKE